MCTHSNIMRINDTRVCLACGFTIIDNGKIFFDKKIVNYKSKKQKGGKKC